MDLLRQLYLKMMSTNSIGDVDRSSSKTSKLNPLSAMFQVSTAVFRESGTKTNLSGRSVTFDSPGALQAIKRSCPWSRAKRSDLTRLKDCIDTFTKDIETGDLFLTDDHFNLIVNGTIHGLDAVAKGYDPNDPIVHALKLYILNLRMLITNRKGEYKSPPSMPDMHRAPWTQARIELVCSNMKHLEVECKNGNSKLVTSMLEYLDGLLDQIDREYYTAAAPDRNQI
jgi:hypothetical protein